LEARERIGELVGFGGGKLEYVKHAARIEGAEVNWRWGAKGYDDVDPVWMKL
jgi:hypothetical protein